MTTRVRMLLDETHDSWIIHLLKRFSTGIFGLVDFSLEASWHQHGTENSFCELWVNRDKAESYYFRIDIRTCGAQA